VTGASNQNANGYAIDAAKNLDYFVSSLNKLGGTNPFGGYGGGWGGSVGPYGSSGAGGGGGAASVVKIGTVVSPSSVATIVAGGGGGQGGSGNGTGDNCPATVTCLQGGTEQKTFVPITGIYPSTFSTLFPNGNTTSGQNGYNAYARWWADSPNTAANYDGGGGGAGGGGARGGSRGTVEFGRGGSLEWYGAVGGSPGENSTSGLGGLSASYSTTTGAVSVAGSVVISYENGNPSPPKTPNGTPGNSMVHLYWGVPTLSGASAITTYSVQYSTSPYTSWTTATDTATTTSFDVTGLTNATSYKFQVKANSSVGSSIWASSPVLTPYVVASAPTITSITPGDASLSVAFTAGSSSFTINNYQYSIDTGTSWVLADQSSSPISIRGLTNGRTYTVQVRAVTAAGFGTASASTQGRPSTVPGAGVVLSATTTGIKTYADGNTGGSPITGYDIYYVSGNATCSVLASSNQTVPTGVLSAQGAGTGFAFKARNANGAGALSNCLVASLTPISPTGVVETVTAQNSAIQVGWSANINDGPISKIEYSLDSGAWIDAGTVANPFYIGALNNGTSYGVQIRVTNSAGTSVATASQSATPRTVPNSPINALAVGAPAAATLTWEAPTYDGGSAITGYTARAYTALTGGTEAGIFCTTTSLTCQITGLSNGTTYYYSVVAANAAGNSVATSPRVQVLPAALPGAPTINSVTSGDTYLTVAFTAGTFDANAPLLYYKYSVDAGTTWISLAPGTSSPFSINLLNNGTIYNVKIRAVASNGDGAASSAVAGTPMGMPLAVDPNSITYVASSGQAIISWSAPENKGSVISRYDLTAFTNISSGSASKTCTTTGSPAATTCTITGLTNGTLVYVSIEATNAVGTSPRSSPRIPVVSGSPTTTTLSVSPLVQSTAGRNVTLTATVGSGGAGTVNFKSGGASISGCSAVTVNSAVATCTTSLLSAGVNVLSAAYSGGGNYASSYSANQNYTINGGVSQTATETTLNVVNGSTAVDTITASGGTGNKTFSLSVSPSVAGITIDTSTANMARLNVASNVTPGSYIATITATDSANATGTINISVIVSSSSTSALTGISLNNGLSISPTFTSGTLSYAATAGNDKTSTVITASWAGYGQTATATFSGSGGGTYQLTNGAALSARPIALSVGANVVTIRSSAQDGSTTSYTITINRAGSSVSALTGLTLSNSVTLNASFASGTTSYTSTVPYTTTSTQITSTWAGVGETATATFGGNTYALTSGSILATLIPLTAGVANEVTIKGYAQDGSTTTYTVSITRTAAASVSSLTGVTLSNSISLNTPFSSGTTSYTTSAPNSTSSTQITATWGGIGETATATFGGNTYTLASGTILSTPVALNANSATVITITGYAQNGSMADL
jgi:predicted RNA-binding protein with TRAM domain